MTKSEAEKFNRAHLLPGLTGWQAKGVHLFLAPVGDMFRGITFQ
jgi:hypothetical protein